MATHVRRKAPGSPAVAPRQVRMLADAMLTVLELQNAELSVLLTNDEHIRVLNREYRDKDRPTDVLSFGICDSIGTRALSEPRLLGDVVISLDTAARQATSRKRQLIAEIRWLLAHGLLHLIGFDHADAAQKRRMVAWTRRLVRAADLPDAKPPRAVKRRGRR